MADIECVFESMTSRGSIYISNLLAAQNVQLLHSMGIKAILSVARSGFLNHSKEDIPHYLYIPAEDHEDYQLHRFFNETFEFIEKARKQTNVLVHCKVGVSRSVTIVIVYLIKKYKYSLSQVIKMVLRRRNKINPNKGFLEQLRNYAESQGIKCDFDTNYIDNLRQQSSSKRKNIFSAHKERVNQKKQLLPITNLLVTKENKELSSQMGKRHEAPVALQSRQELLKNLTQKKKGKSFEDIHTEKAKDIENGESNCRNQKEVLDASLIKKSVSLMEDSRPKRRLSIEQKISKIRDKILKKQHASVQKSPRLKSYQDEVKYDHKPQGEHSFQRSNRFYNSEDRHSNLLKEKPMLNTGTNQNIEHKDIKWQKTNMPVARPSFMLKDEYNQKGDLFAAELNIDSSTFYCTNKIHRRVSSKLANQIYQ